MTIKQEIAKAIIAALKTCIKLANEILEDYLEDTEEPLPRIVVNDIYRLVMVKDNTTPIETIPPYSGLITIKGGKISHCLDSESHVYSFKQDDTIFRVSTHMQIELVTRDEVKTPITIKLFNCANTLFTGEIRVANGMIMDGKVDFGKDLI